VFCINMSIVYGSVFHSAEFTVSLFCLKARTFALGKGMDQGVTKRCRLSWPKCGWVGGVSANEYSCAHRAQINFGDLISYLSYGMDL
jgi:hypothetical protein